MRQLTRPPDLGRTAATATVTLSLLAKDLPLVVAALTTVRREIDQEEFSTRLGADRDAADALGAFLAAALEEGGVNGQVPTMAARPANIDLVLAEDDVSLINNALNEVVNGLYLDEGGLPPGPERNRARALLDKVHGVLIDHRAHPDARRQIGSSPSAAGSDTRSGRSWRSRTNLRLHRPSLVRSHRLRGHDQ